jgi:hypothetical protein
MWQLLNNETGESVGAFATAEQANNWQDENAENNSFTLIYTA